MASDINFKKIIGSLFVLQSLFFTSCEKICDCTKSTGSIESEYRSISSFNKIELHNNIDLVFHVDSVFKLKVTAGKNLLSEIATETNNGSLVLKNNNHCNWVRDFNPTIVVEVWAPSFSNLIAEDASGDVYFEDSLDCHPFTFDGYNCSGIYHLKLKGNEAHVNISGPGDIIASGDITNFYLFSVGYGKIDCVNLQTKYVFATNKGTNNSYVNATDLLDVSIYGDGNIYYKGTPASINKHEYGKGKLISL